MLVALQVVILSADIGPWEHKSAQIVRAHHFVPILHKARPRVIEHPHVPRKGYP